jgi:protein TonB
MLKRAATRRPLGFRVAAVASILAIHVLAAAALSHVRAEREAAPVTEAVQVAFLEESRPPPPPAPRVSLETVQVPQLTLPMVDIPVDAPAAPPAPAAITVIAASQAPTAPTAGADEPVEVQSVDYVRKPRPRYPPMASRMHAHGTVYLRVVVAPEGRARDVRVHRSSGFRLLDEAALSCVQEALFKPHREGGRARAAVVIVPIDFLPNMRTASR